MSMSMEEINEIQTYMQLYDKCVISKKTLLEKVGIDPVKELEQMKKEKEE
jgi:hypothetical protein